MLKINQPCSAGLIIERLICSVIVNIRDFVSDSEKHLSDVELVDKYLVMYFGNKDLIIDLRCLDFSLSTAGFGSAGTLYKACTPNWYFKLSSFSEYSPDVYGYESVCEVIGSRVANCLGYRNANYVMLHCLISIAGYEYTVWLCVSRNYKESHERRTTLENYLRFRGVRGNDLIDNFIQCQSEPFYQDILKLLLFDYIVDNRDRHGANIELLISNSGSIRLAPIYDTVYSLLSPMSYDLERMKAFSPLHNGPVNNFLISMYWDDVLDYIRGEIRVPHVNFNELTLDDLLPCFKEHGKPILKCCKIMIERRYNHAKEILNS